jgi:NADPH:quinone reductase-like Zn-dependent oxidoreductase
MSQNLAALAGGGRIIVVAAAPGDETTIALRHLMAKRGRIFGTTLRRRPLEQKADLVQDFARRVLPQLGNGRLRAVVDRVFALDDVGEALERIRQRGKFGKLLLELDEAAHG